MPDAPVCRMATIYRKTARGQTEIETRALKLAPRFRSLLILVDGRRSDRELTTLMPLAGTEALQALADGGFIEAIGLTADTPRPGAVRAVVAPPAPAPAPAPAPVLPASAPAAPAAPGMPFEQRRREAVRALLDQVGPMAESLAMRMERAPDLDQLKPLLATAAQVLANTRGRAAAAEFSRRFETD